MKDNVYNDYDREAAKILDDFLPPRMFDVHMHLSHLPSSGRERLDMDRYRADMRTLIGDRELRCNGIVMPMPELKDDRERASSLAFLVEQLEAHPDSVGEILVMPWDSAEDIERQLVHPRIRGLKCYHFFAGTQPTFQAGIDEFLPESAWETAQAHGLCITLHMVRDRALADEGNLAYIKRMAARYPGVVLILAHAARAFAAWTAIETVEQLAGFDNVWYDFAGVCESPSMIQILKKIGVKRCMWGTDHPIAMQAGKAISIADTFYWIGERELAGFSAATALHSWHVGTENLMAVRQACLLADLTRSDVEDLFWNNAVSLFCR